MILSSDIKSLDHIGSFDTHIAILGAKILKNGIFWHFWINITWKNGTKYGNIGIKWTVLIRQIDIRTQKFVLTYNTWQKIWKYYECHFSYVFWWKKRVFQRRVFLIIEEAKKMFFLLYICIGMGAATVPMQIPTFGIFEHP